MQVLVIGSGGREHALVWKLAQSKRVTKIFCAPGNAGMHDLAECVDIAPMDISKLIKFASINRIDLTIVGPEAPLTDGIVDRFMKKGLRVFGPTKKAALLEGSKVFTKKFMKKHKIPSSEFQVFSERKAAIKYIRKIGAPIVVKADGLAAGKGVIVAHTVKEAENAVDVIMKDKAFGAAGNKVVVEEFMAGEEASFLAFTDGKTVLPLPTSQDHKPVFDDDQGPNTGGMGAYSPAPVVTDTIHRQVMETIMLRTVRAMEKEGRPYKGVLYAGLMIDKKGKAKVVEFNCRFGDPEAQPLLMRLKSDLVDVVEAVIDERLDEIVLEIDPRPTVCVVMAAGGYPGPYSKGAPIKGVRIAEKMSDVKVFHAGTAMNGRQLVAAGGRVLGVTAIGAQLDQAISKAYEAVEKIKWTGCQYRRDIGQKALRRAQQGPEKPLVGIVMGSDSDLPVMQIAADFLQGIGIAAEMTIASAHRTPGRAVSYAAEARERGLKIIIAGAGMAAHLAGVLAAHTLLPVIGVPLDSSSLNGIDSLLSTAQMPPGVPVATMGIGKSGAKNAAVLATRILALEDKSLADRLARFVGDMAAEVDKKAAALQKKG